MKVLITGGSGFIGSNLLKLVLEEGHEARILDNFSSGFRSNLDPFRGVPVFENDVRNAEAVSRAAQGVEAIYHLAASVGNARSISNPREDSEINVLGTINVLEAARQHGVRKVVFSSSAGIFGELKTLPIHESHPVEPDSPYGASKLGAEKLCLAYHKLHGIEVVCLRYFNVYGVNQRYDAYGNVIPIFAHKMLHRQPLTIYGDGEQTRDFVNVKDVALANYRSSLAKEVSGAFNIASGTRVTVNALVQLMAKVSGIEPQVTHGAPRKGDVRHSLADISAAQKAFAYNPQVALEPGLSEYMAWAGKELITA